MKSFAMLHTTPIAPTMGEDRWFIDGARVSQDEYRKLERYSDRQDTFHSYQFAGRAHHRSVCYK